MGNPMGQWEWIKSKSETGKDMKPLISYIWSLIAYQSLCIVFSLIPNKKQITWNKIMNPMMVQNKIGDMSSEPIVHNSNSNNVGPDWSGLLPELVAEIAIRLPVMEDFVAFRGVCSPWRAAATLDMFNNKGPSKIPLLMLSEKDGGSDDRQLYSLSRKAVWRTMSFPWFKNKRCIYAGCGWVITVAAEGGDVNLVKPFTGDTIALPNYKTHPRYSRVVPDYTFIERGVVSADPSRNSNFVVMVLCPNSGLAYCRLGDKNWRVVDSDPHWCGFRNICIYKGRMYDIDFHGNVRMRDPLAADFTKSKLILKVDVRSRSKPRSMYGLGGNKPYFAESSSGELLLIFRDKKTVPAHDGIPPQYGASRFVVVTIDVLKGKYERIGRGTGIGKDAIFLGENATVCVDAEDFPGVIKSNCIYFTDDCLETYMFDEEEDALSDNKGGGGDMGMYNFEDGRIERLPVESRSFVCPPLWIFPSF